jgi:hypothetical protein
VILLHSATQKQIHNLDSSTWQSELDHAQTCLDVLAFCGSADPVAEKFRNRLLGIYETVAQRSSSHSGVSLQGEQSSAAMGNIDAEMTGYDTTHSLLEVPLDTEPTRRRLALSLLRMLCRPFSDPDLHDAAEEDVKGPHWHADPTRYEIPQLVERLEWHYETSLPLSWDVEKLGVGTAGVGNELLVSGSRFLGSTSPSGWTGTGSLQES